MGHEEKNLLLTEEREETMVDSFNCQQFEEPASWHGPKREAEYIGWGEEEKNLLLTADSCSAASNCFERLRLKKKDQ